MLGFLLGGLAEIGKSSGLLARGFAPSNGSTLFLFLCVLSVDSVEQKQHTSGGVTPTPEVKKLLEQCRQATLLEVQPKIDMLTQQLNILMKNMSTSSQCPHGVSVGTPQSVNAPCDIPPTRSRCHSVDAYPVTTVKGTAYPTTTETTIVHNQPVLPNHVKVMVDEVVMVQRIVFSLCQCCSIRL
nr:uncharacterized protein LOC109183092 [Ipomoea batatas]